MPRQRPHDIRFETRLERIVVATGRPAAGGITRFGSQPRRGGGQQSAIMQPASGNGSGAGQLLTLAASGVSVASGGDYVTFDSEVARHGFDVGGLVSDNQSVSWPIDAVGEIQVEFAWATYEGGGLIEIEVDGTVPTWGMLASSESGRQGSKRRACPVPAGALVRIKVTQTSGSAQLADVLTEFCIPGAAAGTASPEPLPFMLTDETPSQAWPTGTDFFDETFAVHWSGVGSVVLAGDSSGTDSVYVDDRLTLDVTTGDGVTSTLTHTFTSGVGDPVTAAGPFDITSMLTSGRNILRLRMSDVYGTGVNASAMWVAQV